MTYSGKTPSAAMAELKTGEKEYGPKLVEMFSRIVESEPEPAHRAVRKLYPKDLTVGMVIAADVFTSNGIRLIEAGTKINPFLFEILHNSSKTEFREETIQVFASA